MKTSIQSQRGFTMLIGVLVSSVLLSIALVIFNISLKQITLATVGKNSQIALFAADSGLECALYWDLSSDDGGQFDPANPDGSVNCNSQTIKTDLQTVTGAALSIVGGSEAAIDSGSSIFST